MFATLNHLPTLQMPAEIFINQTLFDMGTFSG